MNVRIQAFFSGHVQGVGFRWTTRQIASDFAVTGFVRNLADGRVELVAEGDKVELARLIKEINERLEDNISDVEQQFSDASGKFASFEVFH